MKIIIIKSNLIILDDNQNNNSNNNNINNFISQENEIAKNFDNIQNLETQNMNRSKIYKCTTTTIFAK